MPDLSSLPASSLHAEFRRRQRRVPKLERKRAALLAKVAALDAKIAALGGRPAVAWAVRPARAASVHGTNRI